MIDFTEEELQRYSRHILLQEVGAEGQERIRRGRVLVIGVGGLGSPVALYLAAAGVGTLGIADGDTVEISNLQRQVIHFTPDIGRSKVDSAEEKLRKINPHVRVNTCHENLTADNILDIVREYDFIVDGTDNFPAKYLINDACVMTGKPFTKGASCASRGRLSLTFQVRRAAGACSVSLPLPEACPPARKRGYWELSPGYWAAFRRQRP
mgnify:CR=1 FL=1